MQARQFLDLAREVARGNTEAHWRGVVIHGYYALLLDCRDALNRWGRVIPQRDLHRQVRLLFTFAKDPDLKTIGQKLERLSEARAHASYRMAPGSRFSTNVLALSLLQDAANALALLDAIDADPVRHGAAVASLPP